jgi:hypothetical protein
MTSCRMCYGYGRLRRQAGEIDPLLPVASDQSHPCLTISLQESRKRKRPRLRNRWTEKSLCVRDPSNYIAVAPKRDTKILSDPTRDIDPLAKAKARGQEYRQKSIKESLCSKDVMDILEISEHDLNKLRQSNQIVFLKDGNRYIYPKCQFFSDKIIDGIDQVIEELSIKDGWTQLVFLESEDINLQNDKPINRLIKGDISSVVIAASNYGQHRSL